MRRPSLYIQFSVGPQIYLRDALWIRGGLGVAGFQRREKTATVAQHLYSGLGVQLGAGVEFLTFDDRRVAVSAEVTLIGALYPEGFINGGTLGFGVAYK